jgi:hypothetical protein
MHPNIEHVHFSIQGSALLLCCVIGQVVRLSDVSALHECVTRVCMLDYCLWPCIVHRMALFKTHVTECISTICCNEG